MPPAPPGDRDGRALAEAVAAALTAEVSAALPIGGGDNARAFRLELSGGRFVFAKTQPGAPPGFFTTEATGLDWLRAAGGVAVPRVLAVSDGDAVTSAPNVLVLEWIDATRQRGDERAFGRALAATHRAGAPSFGREDRRTTGSRGLPNEPCTTWAEFYATQRLLPLARIAADTEALSPDVIARLETLAERLHIVGGPPEPPARLHGDLWGGNRLVDASGVSWLIDPACHGGHREFDLAMMALFGGFADDCTAAYHETFPLADGWQDRVALHQVAPLVVHAVKFGGAYCDSARRAIGKYL